MPWPWLVSKKKILLSYQWNRWRKWWNKLNCKDKKTISKSKSWQHFASKLKKSKLSLKNRLIDSRWLSKPCARTRTSGRYNVRKESNKLIVSLGRSKSSICTLSWSSPQRLKSWLLSRLILKRNTQSWRSWSTRSNNQSRQLKTVRAKRSNLKRWRSNWKWTGTTSVPNWTSGFKSS